MLDLYVEISQLLGQAVEVGKMKNEMLSLLAVFGILYLSHAPKALLILSHVPKAAMSVCYPIYYTLCF